MANYLGVQCPVCKKRFADGDDIVVCPVCGAPHHRECYQKIGHCALEELHLNGQVWQDSDRHASPRPSDVSETVCPSCGAHNPRSGLFCQVCGAPLGHREEAGKVNTFGNPFANGKADSGSAYKAAFGGLSPDEKIQGESARDIALYVGGNSNYFLPRFKLLSQHGGVTINWAALLFHAFYFFYRKMFAIGLGIIGVLLVSYIPEFLTLKEQTFYVMQNFTDLVNGNPVVEFVPTEHLWAYKVIPAITFMRFVAVMFLSLFANRIYMVHVLNHVRRIRERFTDASSGGLDDSAYVNALAGEGRTISVGWMIVLVLSYLVLSMAIKMLFVLRV